MVTFSRAPAFGLGWHLWQRHRVGLSLLICYFCLLAFLALAVPATRVSSSALFVGAIPFCFGMLYLIGIVTHPEADVVATGSGYPSYLLTLPVPTRALVFWPMLYGTLLIALAWIGLTGLVLLPRGAPLAVAWPAAMLAAITASLQALFWSPVRLPYLRLLLALTILPTLLLLGMAGSLHGLSERMMTALFLACLPLAYRAALDGVSRARRGDTAERRRLPERIELKTQSERETIFSPLPKPFVSPMQAQFWFEWRRNGTLLPVLVGLFCLLFSLPLFWLSELSPLNGSLSVGREAGIEVNIYLKTYLFPLLLLPPFVGSIVGCGLRKSDTRRGDRTLHLFLATRPLTDLSLVLAKFQVAALSALSACALLFLFGIIWLLLPAREGAIEAPLLLLLLKHITPDSAWLVLFIGLFLLVWTWRNQVVGLFADLSGRTWIVYGYPAIVYSALLAALVNITDWMAKPDSAPSYNTILAAVSWGLGILVTLKALSAVGTLTVLYRTRRITMPLLAKLLIVWLILAGGLSGALYWCLNATVLQALPFLAELRSAPYALAIATLFLPITRLALAALALSSNRHH